MTARSFTRNYHEAYMLMKYVGKNGGEIEWLWNSRDGVAPFGVGSRTSKEILNHADWGEDALVPNFVPPVGMRIFTTLTMEDALALALKRVDAYWDSGPSPMKEHPSLGSLGPVGAADALAKQYFGRGDQPHVVMVTDQLHLHFAKLALVEPFRQERRGS